MEGQDYPYGSTYSDEAWLARSTRFNRRIARLVLGIYSTTAFILAAASAFFGVPEPALAMAAAGGLCGLLWHEVRLRRKLTELDKKAVIARLKG